MDSEKENPLEELYVDADEFDRKQVKEALSGLVGIDEKSGEPRFYEEFDELDTDERFVGLLLYRRALDSLDELEEEEHVGEGSSYFANLLNVDSSTVRNKVQDLSFVEKDEGRGGYFVPSHNIPNACQYVKEGKEE